MVEYTCICCNYITTHKAKYDRHLETKKHKDNEREQGIREVSLEEKLIEANKLIKDLQAKNKELSEINMSNQKTIKTLQDQVKKQEKEDADNKPTPVSKFGDSFIKDFIYPNTIKAFDEVDNEIEDILTYNYHNIRKNIPMFKVYLECRIESSLDPFNTFIKKHIKPKDYKLDDDGEIIFYNESGDETNMSDYSIGLLRKTFAKQITSCDDLYKEYLNEYRRKDQNKHDMLLEHISTEIDYEIFDNILTNDNKSITKRAFEDALQS